MIAVVQSISVSVMFEPVPIHPHTSPIALLAPFIATPNISHFTASYEDSLPNHANNFD
jgi:hypothetical protein